ncbi:DNA polymerase Y family protein [Pigmentiphaga aceris]|uniref:DNA polymerase Y family protein n=1 Tax=Pigmentiphaga aceris TaxID=1940612 RepID=A0A5C0B416_9BURK|nr:DNA polymerase Y family protein [Pigmentiphaga aceris]QEI07277.1 DNA polymerase Y family protein [Pigmentiphaga aceris]
MHLWICVHLSRLSLDVLHTSWPTEAVVVLEHECAIALSPQAIDQGLQAGMRRNSLSALAPDVLMIERQPLRETDTRDGTALALLQYTPELAHADEDSLLLDVAASLRLFGGPRNLCRRIRSTVAALGLHAQLGMAPTATGAWLMARRGRRVLRMAPLVRHLNTMPCTWLPAARPHRDWFDGLGCRTLGAVRALPRAGLQRRCGKPLIQALDAAHGDTPELFEWVIAPASFSRRIELIARIDHAEAALFVARHLVEQLCGWLAVQQRAVSQITLVLEHERGRHAIAPTRVDIALAEPAWQPEHLVRLLRERLGRLELLAPVIQIGLEAPDSVPFAPPSDSLFPEPGGTPADRRRLVELLTARLGPEQVLQVAARADHRPEVANHWAPINHRPAKLPDAPVADRPFWLLDTPIALVMRDNRPLYGTPLHKVRGPERIESGWWDQLAIRDYFVYEDEHATRYWLYQDRNPGADIKWFLHGIFG